MHQLGQKQDQKDNRGTSYHAGYHHARVLEHNVREAGRGLLKCGGELCHRSGQFLESGADVVEDAVD